MKKDWGDLVDKLEDRCESSGAIVHSRYHEAQAPTFADLRTPLHPALMEALRRRGIEKLFAHQVEAVDAAAEGEHVAIVTATASGKTLCYNLPVLNSILEDRRTRALYLFPTKALGHDQLRKLEELDLFPDLRAAAYDGDTSMKDRRVARNVAQILLTNPDMLHVGLLPNHTLWASFLMGLRYVVVDEMHVYRGIFGSHTAQVLRRLRRLAGHYGSSPQFLCASATIQNPQDTAGRLTGLTFRIVTDERAPRGAKHFVFWNPPQRSDPGAGRRSANVEAVKLLRVLMQEKVRTIAFVRARVTAELLLRYAKQQLGRSKLSQRLSSYRAGYLPEERRAIEKALFDGELLGVISTTALELGVDIGGLDAALIVGYPGTIASTWQQAGRAGRGTTPALVILVGEDTAVDQFLMRRPDYVFERASEPVVLDPDNQYIKGAHLLAACDELPLAAGESALFGHDTEGLLARLGEAGLVTKTDRWHWTGMARPHDQINLRTVTGTPYEIRDAADVSRLIGTVDGARAFYTIHEGAVYLHQGESFVVERLDCDRAVGFARQAAVDYYTQPMTTVDVAILGTSEALTLNGAEAAFGQIEVTSRVVAYRRVHAVNQSLLGTERLDLPPTTFETTGMWIRLSEALADWVGKQTGDLMGAMHAAEHGCIAMMPVIATCDPQDIEGVSHQYHPDTHGPTVFLYDNYPGGAGLAERSFDQATRLFQVTAEALRSCPCAEGCPSCVQSSRCGDNNFPLSKSGALLLLELLGASPEGPLEVSKR